MTNKILIISATAILASQVFLLSPAFAQTATPTPAPRANFFQGLVNFIAQKFNLDKTQVQTAIEDYKNQNRPSPRPTPSEDQILAKEKIRLDKLVSEGKITGDQETAILAENKVLLDKYNPANFKNETPDQRKQQFMNEQADIKTWASANNIDARYLILGFSGPMRGFMGMHRGFGNWKPSPTP